MTLLLPRNMLNFALFKDYLTLCKPKVILVMLITAWVGMQLATYRPIPGNIFIFGTLGIALIASSAAVINHLVERNLDAQMLRTANRPMANKRIPIVNVLFFSLLLNGGGVGILITLVNPLTALLTFLTMMGYAGLYTLFLKRRTPQNIVIAGAAGAMPPLLGWTAVTGEINPLAWLLVLIIFAWTPPHFWALAIYRKDDYEKVNIPMLPNTHGIPFTKLFMVLYTFLLLAITLLPYVTYMSGKIYFVSALVLGVLFLRQTLLLYKTDSAALALKTFSFSIVYLLLIFTALLLDHYAQILGWRVF